MAYDNNGKRFENVYSERVKAGNGRTYFFDIKPTSRNDYYLVITESRKRLDDEGYERSRIFVYKEDFNKFNKGLDKAVGYVKTELLPNFDFEAFDKEYDNSISSTNAINNAELANTNDTAIETNTEADKW